ncbi:MAG: HAD-IIA family hydrolase [Bacteroidales bacterium]|jgi:4-nitrophenyl phosphatase|nr:HAD-IIA family hydrolase [Bacteroidales bacterium]
MIQIGTHPISCFVFDLDGTVYCENTVIDNVVPFFSYLYSQQISFYFFTNNSSHSKDFYLRKLHDFGLNFIEKHQIITSTDVLISYLNSKNISHISCIGTDDMQEELKLAGVSIIIEKNQSIEAVVIGFDTSLQYHKLEIANHYARKGVPIFATNEDLVCPVSHNEFIPDCGSITTLIEKSSGYSAQFFGKPQKVAAEYICNYTKTQAEQICMIGDRLYTDMKMALHNFKTILVLSGETTEDMARASEQHVDYIISDITKLQKLFS